MYDIRACGLLVDFHAPDAEMLEARVWEGFVRYRAALRAAVDGPLSLRENDSVLSTLSGTQQLQHDIACGFSVPI